MNCKISNEFLLGMQFLSEANDILSWLTEKHQLLSGNDFGRDSAASDSLLTKHKVCLDARRHIFTLSEVVSLFVIILN